MTSSSKSSGVNCFNIYIFKKFDILFSNLKKQTNKNTIAIAGYITAKRNITNVYHEYINYNVIYLIKNK